MGLQCLPDLIKILYITSVLKSSSQILSILDDRYYTLKIEFTHKHTHTQLFVYMVLICCSQR